LFNFPAIAVAFGYSCKSRIIENAVVLQAFQQLVNAVFKGSDHNFTAFC
jgi:hypothetical protein